MMIALCVMQGAFSLTWHEKTGFYLDWWHLNGILGIEKSYKARFIGRFIYDNFIKCEVGKIIPINCFT